MTKEEFGRLKPGDAVKYDLDMASPSYLVRHVDHLGGLIGVMQGSENNSPAMTYVRYELWSVVSHANGTDKDDRIQDFNAVDIFFNRLYHHGLEYDTGKVWGKYDWKVDKGENAVLRAIGYALKNYCDGKYKLSKEE